MYVDPDHGYIVTPAAAAQYSPPVQIVAGEYLASPPDLSIPPPSHLAPPPFPQAMPAQPGMFLMPMYGPPNAAFGPPFLPSHTGGPSGAWYPSPLPPPQTVPMPPLGSTQAPLPPYQVSHLIIRGGRSWLSTQSVCTALRWSCLLGTTPNLHHHHNTYHQRRCPLKWIARCPSRPLLCLRTRTPILFGSKN
jgi:hypothetical protein